MEGYTSEREQVEAIKQWWRDNGKGIVLGLVVGLGGLAAWRYWNDMQDVQATNASITYEQFLNLTAQGAGQEARDAGQSILDNYPKTTYARLAALLLAKLDVEDGKLDDAKRRLQWVTDNQGGPELVALARARMAQIVLAEGQAEAALSTFEQIEPARAARFGETRGDILAALGRKAEAASAYEEAQKLVTDSGADPRVIELKLESLGLDRETR